MNYLIVVAHPDDETLGAGGMIYNLIKSGNNVSICFMCANAEARKGVSNTVSMQEQAIESLGVLGLKKENILFGHFPNIKLNTVPHIDVVKFIESSILKFEPDIVITHYGKDLNNDHKITSECCDEAIRYFQRNKNIKEIKKYMYMEVLSSTDWITNDSFSPNYFYEINEEALEFKIKALEKYEGAIREYPHSRSIKNIKSLATIRGAQSNLNYAESFIIAFERAKNE